MDNDLLQRNEVLTMFLAFSRRRVLLLIGVLLLTAAWAGYLFPENANYDIECGFDPARPEQCRLVSANDMRVNRSISVQQQGRQRVITTQQAAPQTGVARLPLVERARLALAGDN